MSIVRSLMWLVDRIQHREVESQHKRWMQQFATPDPNDGTPPPEATLVDPPLLRRCRICGWTDRAHHFCLHCLADSMRVVPDDAAARASTANPRKDATGERTRRRLWSSALVLALSWVFVLASAAWTWSQYEALPELVPAYRSILDDADVLRPKTPLMVLRVPAMAAVQLGVVHALAVTSRHGDFGSWHRFWTASAAAIAVKAVVTATEWRLLTAPVTNIAWLPVVALVPAALLALFGVHLLRRRQLPMKASGLQSLRRHGGLKLFLLTAAATYGALATVPIW